MNTQGGVPARALAFRPRLQRADEAIVAAAQKRGDQIKDLDEGSGLRGLTLFEIFPTEESVPRHYGKFSRSLWTLVDQIFKAADFSADSPPGASAKSVQVADIYEPPPGIISRNAFLVLWFAQHEPVMVPCPEVPDALLMAEGTNLDQTREALHSLIWEMTERLNIIMPAARAIAGFHPD